MLLDIIKDAILANIGSLKSAPKGWFKRCCPLCHTQGHSRDTRFRFGLQFNPNNILVNCFNCKFSAAYTEGTELSKSFKFFLKQINLDDAFIKQLEFEIFKQKNDIKEVRDGDIEKGVPDLETKIKTLFSNWHPSSLPKDSLSITEWLEAGLTDPEFLNVVNYALDRKIYDLDKFYWSPVTEFNLNQRLIIPYHYKNRIVGFTSRLSNDNSGKDIPKYYQQCPYDFVYNLDHQQGWLRKYVIVNEGVLDAWSTDGVATLGEITQTKIDIINRLQKQVIVCTDRDKSGTSLITAAIDNNWAVSFPAWDPDIKDASAASVRYGRLLTTHSIVSSAITNKLTIEARWKIESDERARRQNK